MKKALFFLILCSIIGCSSIPWCEKKYSSSFDALWRNSLPIQTSYFECVSISLDTIIPLVGLNRDLHRLFYKEDSLYLYAAFINVKAIGRLFPKDEELLCLYSNRIQHSVKYYNGNDAWMGQFAELIKECHENRLYSSPSMACLIIRKGEEEIIKNLCNRQDTMFFACFPNQWPNDTLFCDLYYEEEEMKAVASSFYNYQEWGRILDSCYYNALNGTGCNCNER